MVLVAVMFGSCSRPCDDNLLLGASDELYSLRLYSGGEFDINPNAVNVFKGHYSLIEDTIFLTYNNDECVNTKHGDEKQANDVLVRKILINDSLGIVKAIGSYSFFATIYCNKLQNNNE